MWRADNGTPHAAVRAPHVSPGGGHDLARRSYCRTSENFSSMDAGHPMRRIHMSNICTVASVTPQDCLDFADAALYLAGHTVSYP